MKDWRNALVKPGMSIRETIGVIDAAALQLALVVTDDGRLLGTVTDGDIRRAILRGVSLEEPVESVMNVSPTVAYVGASRDEIHALLARRNLQHIPVVDDSGFLVDLVMLRDLLRPEEKPNWVVLMAGGEGTRLRPLTSDLPKPLLPVGSRPLLETILNQFVSSGFRRFFISVRYKAELVEEYFGDGGRWGVEVHYLKEQVPMGTAGCLSLLPSKPEAPLVVMNGDLLTNVNFTHLLAFHERMQSHATVCVREHQIRVPYGVVEVNDHRLESITEKPVQRFFINAGIYVLEPAVLKWIPHNHAMDMTELLQLLLERNHLIGAFPIHEYWTDIGRMDDYLRAQEEIAAVFGE